MNTTKGIMVDSLIGKPLHPEATPGGTLIATADVEPEVTRPSPSLEPNQLMELQFPEADVLEVLRFASKIQVIARTRIRTQLSLSEVLLGMMAVSWCKQKTNVGSSGGKRHAS